MTDHEQRIAALESTVEGLDDNVRQLSTELTELKQQLEQYRQIFATAVKGPVARQVLSTLGIKLPDRL